jgi:hypothetical protein
MSLSFNAYNLNHVMANSLQGLYLKKELLDVTFIRLLWCACIFSSGHPHVYK